MPWKDPPQTDFLDDPEFHWPSWKVEVPMEDLFGDLHDRFNTAPMFIQDANAFHHDVTDIACLASDQADFYIRLQHRRDQRLAELKKMIRFTDSFELRGHYDLHMNKTQRSNFFLLRRHASLDSLIAFLASFLGPNESGELPCVDKLLSSTNLRKKYEHILKNAPATGPITSAQSQQHETPKLPPSSTTADESDLTETELDEEEQVLGLMRRKRKRSTKLIDETISRGKRQRTDTGERDKSQETAGKDSGSSHAAYRDAATQTTENTGHTSVSRHKKGPCERPKAKGTPQRRPRAPQQNKSQSLPAITAQKQTFGWPDGPSDRATRARRRAERKADAEQD